MAKKKSTKKKTSQARTNSGKAVADRVELLRGELGELAVLVDNLSDRLTSLEHQVKAAQGFLQHDRSTY